MAIAFRLLLVINMKTHFSQAIVPCQFKVKIEDLKGHVSVTFKANTAIIMVYLHITHFDHLIMTLYATAFGKLFKMQKAPIPKEFFSSITNDSVTGWVIQQVDSDHFMNN